MQGHYRIGQVYHAAGKLDEAKKAYTAGLIYSNKDPQILAAIEQLVSNPKGSQQTLLDVRLLFITIRSNSTSAQRR